MSSRKPFADLSVRQQQRKISRCLVSHEIDIQHPEIKKTGNIKSTSPVITSAASPDGRNADSSNTSPESSPSSSTSLALPEDVSTSTSISNHLSEHLSSSSTTVPNVDPCECVNDLGFILCKWAVQEKKST